VRVTASIAPASILGPLTQNGLTEKLVLILHFAFTCHHPKCTAEQVTCRLAVKEFGCVYNAKLTFS
jgi:hypothetical protein